MTPTAPASPTTRTCPSCGKPDALKPTGAIGAVLAEGGPSEWRCASCGNTVAELPLMGMAEMLDRMAAREREGIAGVRAAVARLEVLEAFDRHRGSYRGDYGKGQRYHGLMLARRAVDRAAGEFTSSRLAELERAGELEPTPADRAAAYNHEVKRKARRRDVLAEVLEALERTRRGLSLPAGDPFELVAGSYYVPPATAPALHYARVSA